MNYNIYHWKSLLSWRNSYYLSSHHIDIHCWIMQGRAVPTRVTASAATGIATSEPFNCVPQTEDTITLLVDWQSLTSSKHKGTAVYTASWTAPLKSGVHTAQHWYYMAEKVRRNSDRTMYCFLWCRTHAALQLFT